MHYFKAIKKLRDRDGSVEAKGGGGNSNETRLDEMIENVNKGQKIEKAKENILYCKLSIATKLIQKSS